MGIWSRFFGRESKSSRMRIQDLWADIFGAKSAKSGARVNWRTAMEATSALACARVIADGLSQIPFRLYQKADRKRIPAVAHPIYGLLADAPNDFQTSYEFREMLAFHLVFCGNAFVWKNRVNGRIVELLPFMPQEVMVKRDGWVLSYDVSMANGQTYSLPASEMWHLRGPSWNGWMGLEGVKLAREAIGLALATEEHGARFFGNGATPGGILTTEQSLDPEQRKALRDSWEARHAGGENAHKTAVLWGGMKFSPMATQNDQAQFLETRKFQVEEICRAFRVLPIMVGSYDKAATYASSEQMFLAHVVYTLCPWCARIEGSANVSLLTPEERSKGFYTKFNVNGLLRGAAKDRGEFYAKMYGVGALSPNDIRELEDMDPYEGGDEYRVPLNMAEPGTDQNQNQGGGDAAA